MRTTYEGIQIEYKTADWKNSGMLITMVKSVLQGIPNIIVDMIRVCCTNHNIFFELSVTGYRTTKEQVLKDAVIYIKRKKKKTDKDFNTKLKGKKCAGLSSIVRGYGNSSLGWSNLSRRVPGSFESSS